MSRPASQVDAVSSLYGSLIDAWNARDAKRFASLFADVATVVGFDGSGMTGRTEIEATLAKIFADHPTPPYISKIRSVRLIALDVAVLQAHVGMVPPGQSDIQPQLNAVQLLVAVRRNGEWRIEAFQNTPAAFHGRPDLAAQFTAELRDVLARKS
jgi:uncharacterized protein (TIGR02246 family)